MYLGAAGFINPLQDQLRLPVGVQNHHGRQSFNSVFVKQYLVSGGIIVAIFLVAVLFGATGFHRSPPTKSATNQIN